MPNTMEIKADAAKVDAAIDEFIDEFVQKIALLSGGEPLDGDETKAIARKVLNRLDIFFANKTGGR